MIYNVGGAAGNGNRMPLFSYTGDYELLDDGRVDGVQNWRIKLKTSGVLTFSRLASPVDIFAVGGGGGGYLSGGGGGYTSTCANQNLLVRQDYTVLIGAGGDVGSNYGLDGGSSSFGSICSAVGGTGGNVVNGQGGQGGSGGGNWGNEGKAGSGGSDGSDGAGHWYQYQVDGRWDWYQGEGGKGQGTTTREFGEETGDLYAGGGGGGNANKPHNNGGYGGEGGGGHGAGRGPNSSLPATGGSVNTGGGGGGGYLQQLVSMAGGSGIVVIRNHR